MIAAITGELRRVEDDRISLQVGPMLYELLVAAADVPVLQGGVGREMTFHTVFYFEGDSSGGNMEPRLVGFLRTEDKAFFQQFITVKGIGPKKALRALALPVGEIAHAIEGRDARVLVELPGIGKRMAEQIVAELAGKVGRFATHTGKKSTPLPAAASRRNEAEEDAIQTLLALGEKRVDAEALLDRAQRGDETLVKTDALVREMLRLRTSRG